MLGQQANNRKWCSRRSLSPADEIKQIGKQGVRVDESNLIYRRQNIIMPFHKEMDEIREDTLAKTKLELQEGN